MIKKTIIILMTIIVGSMNANSQGCLPNGIVFELQTQIDSFQYYYPWCSKIEGDVFISGNDIVNLQGLENISIIDGTLEIVRCNILENLAGLENLDTVWNELNVSYNPSLKSFSALSNLKYTKYLTISTNNSLQHLYGLEGLNMVEKSFTILQNSSLLSLEGLENIDSIGQSLIVQDNDQLENLTGLTNVKSIGSIEISDNESIISLAGLTNLETLYYSLDVSFNNSLLSICQIGNLTEIGGLSVWNNENLNSLEGLTNINIISDFVDIVWNTNLTSLSGLENIAAIGGPLFIRKNDKLTDLSAFINTKSIGGSIYIIENDLLSSLYGLDNISYESISELNIYLNPNLLTCEVKSVCDYLGDPTGSTYIANNGTGCNNEGEIKIACETVNIQQEGEPQNISFYPNPNNHGIININNTGEKLDYINILNLQGERLNRIAFNTNAIDISTLEEGLYIIEFVSDHSRIRNKLLVTK